MADKAFVILRVDLRLSVRFGGATTLECPTARLGEGRLLAESLPHANGMYLRHPHARDQHHAAPFTTTRVFSKADPPEATFSVAERYSFALPTRIKANTAD